ncbi:MAG TPA: penicillin acylase family protein, partial [Vicinamibacteria bacterium]
MATPRRHNPLVTLVAASVVFMAILVVLAPPEPRPRLAQWRAAGADRDVRILRDTWGVPHVYGKTDADAAYGLAWAHAEDDFETIQSRLLAARGRLASEVGSGGAPSDYVVALLRVRETVDAKYATDLSSGTRAVCEAYAEAINRYAALHPGQALPALYPVTGKDVVAGFVQALPFFFDFDKVLQELMGDARVRPVSRKQATTAASTEATDGPRGSNTIAVAPSRSADGFTRLAVNSHQPWDGPFAWYEAHVRSEEGWDMAGGVFPGAPVILHGHNRDLGWAFVVNQPDLADV